MIFFDLLNVNNNFEVNTLIQVKIFDEEHERDLEKVVNDFLKSKDYATIVDIKYQIQTIVTKDNEQIYCYSAMVIYRVIK